MRHAMLDGYLPGPLSCLSDLIPDHHAYIAAPELIRGERYSEKADIYSFGILMWEVLTRRYISSSSRLNSTSRRFKLACVLLPQTTAFLTRALTSWA